MDKEYKWYTPVTCYLLCGTVYLLLGGEICVIGGRCVVNTSGGLESKGMLPYSSRVLRGKKFGEFGESSMIRHQTKLVLTINNLSAVLLFRQTFSKCLKRVNLPNFLTVQYTCYIW